MSLIPRSACFAGRGVGAVEVARADSSADSTEDQAVVAAVVVAGIVAVASEGFAEQGFACSCSALIDSAQDGGIA